MSSFPRFICRSCRSDISSSMACRAFTTSTSRPTIPPEAPNYVDIPLTFQPDLVLPKRPKGIIPVPREIFPPRQPDKPSPRFIAQATKDKLAKNVVPQSKMSEMTRYKVRAGATRKKLLTEGLLELHHRKQSMTAQVAARSERKRQEHNRLIHQAEREDQRLTNASTPLAMQPVKGTQHPSTLDIEALAATKRANVARKEAERLESRRKALHELYMNGRSFITTEQQLVAKIDEVFQNPSPQWISAASHGTSIWSLGEPKTVENMLSDSSNPRTANSDKRSRRQGGKRYSLDQERMKRIAEELSGGKI